MRLAGSTADGGGGVIVVVALPALPSVVPGRTARSIGSRSSSFRLREHAPSAATMMASTTKRFMRLV
jgi:hypothetical protein